MFLQALMNNLFLSNNACPLGKAIFSWIFKRYRRILSFVSQWTSCRTPTSSEPSQHQLMFLLSTFNNTLAKDIKTGVYSFQLDELWFSLNADLLRNALGITPKDFAHPFVPPPLVICLYQPWRTILSMINQCLTDYAELIWEEFIQAIKNFFSDMANLKVPTKKPKPPVIPYCRFTNKGGVGEVFGMPIPKDLITDAIWKSEYYNKYLEMAARKPRQLTTMTGEEVEKKKKALKAGKSKQLAPAKQPKPAKKKTSNPTPSKKIHKGKRSDHLVDKEDEEGQPASEPQVENDEYNLQRGERYCSDEQVAQSLLDLQKPKNQSIKDQYIFQRRTPVTQDASTRPFAQPQDDTSVNMVHDTLSLVDSTNDAETAADMEQSNKETDTEILNVVEEQGQAGSDPDKTPESRPPPELELKEEEQAGSDPGQIHVAQAGPNPEPMHEDFIATVYPENLKDAFTFSDQFLNDKSTKKNQEKLMWKLKLNPWLLFLSIKLLYQFFHYPLLSLISHILNQYPDLATRVSALEKRSADFEQKNKLQDKKTQALASKVYKLEHHDLYSMIDKQVNEVVKEAVHNALQAPLCERFRDSSEFQMKDVKPPKWVAVE
ncbi:hypothetical protein Tco_1139186 [Tanacetum coccineum]